MDRKTKNSAGFSLLEITIALVILTVGILALAGLISKTSSSTDRSRYMSMAGLLTSEKLEELSRLPLSDPSISIPTGHSAGSLPTVPPATPVPPSPPVLVGAASVVYYDEVYLSSGAGNVTETITKVDAGGNITYLTQPQTPDAGTQTGIPATSTPPAIASDGLNFERRWIIEDSTLSGLPVGVRRITVQVTLKNSPVQPPVTFQMSTARQ